MSDPPGSRVLRPLWTIATIIWRERGINRHEESQIARSTQNFFWQPNQTHNFATLSAGGLE